MKKLKQQNQNKNSFKQIIEIKKRPIIQMTNEHKKYVNYS